MTASKELDIPNRRLFSHFFFCIISPFIPLEYGTDPKWVTYLLPEYMVVVYFTLVLSIVCLDS